MTALVIVCFLLQHEFKTLLKRKQTKQENKRSIRTLSLKQMNQTKGQKNIFERQRNSSTCM